jgi:hypothetical protein
VLFANPHPQPFSPREKGVKSLSLGERGWGEGEPSSSLPWREIDNAQLRFIGLLFAKLNFFARKLLHRQD